MTTKPTAARTFPPLPDPPQREPAGMTAFNHLTASRNCKNPIADGNTTFCQDHLERKRELEANSRSRKQAETDQSGVFREKAPTAGGPE